MIDRGFVEVSRMAIQRVQHRASAVMAFPLGVFPYFQLQLTLDRRHVVFSPSALYQ